MKFTARKQAHPLTRFAVSAVAPAVALSGAGLAAYAFLQDPSWLPLGVAFAVLTGLEALWTAASRR